MSRAAVIDVLKRAYSALNRGDIEGFVKDFDPEIERIEFEGSPMAGAFHGIEDVRAHVTQGRSTWAEGSCEPERFVAADVFTFRNGKVTEFRTFADEQQALEWAGAE